MDEVRNENKAERQEASLKNIFGFEEEGCRVVDKKVREILRDLPMPKECIGKLMEDKELTEEMRIAIGMGLGLVMGGIAVERGGKRDG